MREIDQIVFRKTFAPGEAIPSDLLYKRLVTDDLRYILCVDISWTAASEEMVVVCIPFEDVAKLPDDDDSILDRLYPIIGTVEGFLAKGHE